MHPMTQKAAWRGNAKWKLCHLPLQTDESFKNLLVPLAHQKVGTLGPWEVLSVAEVQNLVDHVYGVNKCNIVGDNVWFGLVHLSETKWFYDHYSFLNIELSYCLNN
jgi:hypothetical protein